MSTAITRQLSQATPPWVYVADTDSQEFLNTLASLRESGGVVVELNCSTMQTSAQLFSAFAIAAQFPAYFGRNWPAFDECLADLDWLPGSSYVFVLKSPLSLLAYEPSEKITFWQIINKVAAEWAEPVNLGEWWDRDGIAFHVILEMPQGLVVGEDEDRVMLAGVEAALLASRG